MRGSILELTAGTDLGINDDFSDDIGHGTVCWAKIDSSRHRGMSIIHRLPSVNL